MMKRLSAGLFTLTLLSLATFLPTAQAQQAVASINSPKPFTYNLSEEVTLKGTVSSVLEKPSKGMIMGSHLVVKTSTGTVDASLGTSALRGKGAVPVSAGAAVELTGVMKTIKNQPVFLVRTVKEGGQTYTIRNVHGSPLNAKARERADAKTTQKGEGL
jgi:DNA/RNA endonuclease YhcR with UshA esterase domain